jgi:hypothetical protein
MIQLEIKINQVTESQKEFSIVLNFVCRIRRRRSCKYEELETLKVGECDGK